MTAIPLESDPVILLWDLRNSNAPERVSHCEENACWVVAADLH